MSVKVYTDKELERIAARDIHRIAKREKAILKNNLTRQRRKEETDWFSILNKGGGHECSRN